MALLAGCAQYPMGLSQQQWEALSPSEQAGYQAKQYAIDQQDRQQAEARRLEQQRIAVEQALADKERISQIYANAKYGDIVRVNVVGGFIEHKGKRHPYEPVSVDLVRGETKQVIFLGEGNNTLSTRYNVRLSEDGNTVVFDDSYRQRIVMVNQDWERGQSYRPEGTRNDESAFSGMTFFVKFKELPGAPRRIIIEHR